MSHYWDRKDEWDSGINEIGMHCTVDDLKKFVEETGSFEKTSQWAREDSSQGVLKDLFPILADLTKLIKDYKDKSKTIDKDNIRNQLKNDTKTYQSSDKTVTCGMKVKAYLDAMELLVGIFIDDTVKNELGTSLIKFARDEFSKGITTQGLWTETCKMCEQVFDKDEAAIKQWRYDLKGVAWSWKCAVCFWLELWATEKHCAEVLMFLAKACKVDGSPTVN